MFNERSLGCSTECAGVYLDAGIDYSDTLVWPMMDELYLAFKNTKLVDSNSVESWFGGECKQQETLKTNKQKCSGIHRRQIILVIYFRSGRSARRAPPSNPGSSSATDSDSRARDHRSSGHSRTLICPRLITTAPSVVRFSGLAFSNEK
jgi:hypothetical protein